MMEVDDFKSLRLKHPPQIQIDREHDPTKLPDDLFQQPEVIKIKLIRPFVLPDRCGTPASHPQQQQQVRVEQHAVSSIGIH